MKIALLVALVAAFVGSGTALAQDVSPGVRLLVQGKPVTLSRGDQASLRQQIIKLVESSSFHSGPDDKYHVFTAAGVQQDYRDIVGTGEYLLLILPEAQRIETLDGNITVTEIVVGLRSPGSQNCVFTIDASGRLISHAKYAGELLVALRKTAAQARP